jgi:hypothetical protein
MPQSLDCLLLSPSLNPPRKLAFLTFLYLNLTNMDSETLRKLAVYVPVVGGLSVLAWKTLTKPKVNARGLPLPPGPKPLPLIGNLLDLPTGEVWKTYREWEKLYGDIIYTNALGTHVIILNSLDAINDLMEKRGSIYSSRPRCVWVNELCVSAGRYSRVILTTTCHSARASNLALASLRMATLGALSVARSIDTSTRVPRLHMRLCSCMKLTSIFDLCSQTRTGIWRRITSTYIMCACG